MCACYSSYLRHVLKLVPMRRFSPARHDNIPANHDNLWEWELTPFAATVTPSAWRSRDRFDIVGTGVSDAQTFPGSGTSRRQAGGIGGICSLSAPQGGSSARSLPTNPSACLHGRAFFTLARD